MLQEGVVAAASRQLHFQSGFEAAVVSLRSPSVKHVVVFGLSGDTERWTPRWAEELVRWIDNENCEQKRVGPVGVIGCEKNQ